jgi:hypothetical protein
MLQLFLDWARQLPALESQELLDVRVAEGVSSANPAARIDIDTPTMVARITCWESGDYDAEVIDLETERTLYSCHGVLRAGQPIAEHFSPFLKVLGIADL